MMATNLILHNSQNSIDLLRQRIKELRLSISNTAFEIEHLFEKFGDRDNEILQEIAMLDARLSDLKETFAQREVDTTIVDSDVEEVESIPVQVKTDVRKLCKKLYLKICKKCHPDKVKDNKLIQMFYQAKNAMTDLNLGILEAILLSVDESLFNPIEDKDTLAFLQLEVRKYEQELTGLQESEEYQIVDIYQREGFDAAFSVRSRSLRVTRANLREEVFNLGGEI